MPRAIDNGKFREDLFYRLNTVPIKVPALRDRGEDIFLLFRKFAVDFAEKYRMPAIRLDSEAKNILLNYSWPGNVRQLKNITEQISIIENEREIVALNLRNYLPDYGGVKLPAVIKKDEDKSFSSEREILYKILFDMKSDMNDLKKLVFDLIRRGEIDVTFQETNSRAIKNLFREAKEETSTTMKTETPSVDFSSHQTMNNIQDTEEIIEESLSLADKEVEMIKKALEKYNGKRKMAATNLGYQNGPFTERLKNMELNRKNIVSLTSLQVFSFYYCSCCTFLRLQGNIFIFRSNYTGIKDSKYTIFSEQGSCCTTRA